MIETEMSNDMNARSLLESPSIVQLIQDNLDALYDKSIHIFRSTI